MQNFNDFYVDSESPLELFSGLVLAVVRSRFVSDPMKPVRAKELLENEELKAFMKDELGMFNYEQSLTTKALHLQSLLAKVEEFDKKGERRKLAMMKSDSFPLALQIAERDYSLKTESLHYWQKQYKQYGPQLEELLQQRPRTKKSSRRKSRKKPRS